MTFSKEGFHRLYEHSRRLSRIADKTLKFRKVGLDVTEFEALISDLKEALEQRYARGKELYIIELLDWLSDLVRILERRAKKPKRRFLRSMPFPRLTTLFSHLKDGKLPPLPTLRNVLPKLPPLGPARTRLKNMMHLLDIRLPPLPDPGQVLEEVERTVDLLLQDLATDTRLLSNFFDEITPESIPWIVDLFKKEPGEARTTLGEPLCVWWLRMVLAQSKDQWSGTYGPIKTFDIEIDAFSVRGAVAEIKNARPGREKYEGACRQLAEKTKTISEDPSFLKFVVPWMPKDFKLREATIVTLYHLGDFKEEIKEMLTESMQRENIQGILTEIYDGDDILEELNKWSPKAARRRYIKLFSAVMEILRKTL